MRQLNKSQSIQLAKEMLRQNKDIYKLTLEQARSLPDDWQERRRRAIDMADVVLETRKQSGNDYPHPSYESAWRDEYANGIINIWIEPIADHQRKVKNWHSKLRSGTPYDGARKGLQLRFEELKIANAAFEDGWSIRVGIGRTWHGADVTIYIKFDREFDHFITNPDDETQRIGEYSYRFEISSGGTSRSLAQAVKHVKAMQQAIEIVGELQSYLDEMSAIIWTDGIPEPKIEATVEVDTSQAEKQLQEAAAAAVDQASS